MTSNARYTDDSGSIPGGLAAALRFVPRAWAQPWFLGLLIGAVVVGLGVIALNIGPPWSSPLVALGMFGFLPLLQGPLYAVALPDVPKLSPAQWIGRYVRLVTVSGLTLVFMAVPILLLFVVGLGASYGMAYASPGFDPADVSTWTASGPVLAGAAFVVVLGAVALTWLAARVALGPAESVVQGRVLLLSTWPLTRGRGWKIMVTRWIFTAPVLILVGAVAFGARGAFHGAGAAQIISLLSTLAVVGLRMPLNVGLLSYFHRHRAPLPTFPAP